MGKFEGELKKDSCKKLKFLIENSNPGDFNQALMEFGALQCLPNKPLCYSCIFKLECKAYLMNDIKSYPKKKIKSFVDFLDFVAVM